MMKWAGVAAVCVTWFVIPTVNRASAQESELERWLESGVFVVELAENECGREEIEFTADGWSCKGSTELPGVPPARYESRRWRDEAGVEHWFHDVHTRGIQVVIEATGSAEEFRASLPNQGVETSLAVGELSTPFFFENLLWGCFVDVGRHFAALASVGELQGGATMSAVMVHAEHSFPIEMVESRIVPEVLRGELRQLHVFDLLALGQQEMVLVTTADGTPISIAVPAQSLRVCLEEFRDLRAGLRQPITIVDSGSWREKLSPASFEWEIDKNVRIPMRDGAHLAADVYRPVGEGKFPAILVRTPYNRATEAITKGAYYARRGYAVIAQDVRGRFDSEGEWLPFFHEVDDGSDTLDWIAAQPWSDGKVGMIGASYVGWVQWWAAKSGNPHLKAIVPQVAPPDPDQNFPYEGGLFLLASAWWTKVLDHMDAGGVGIPQFDYLGGMSALPLGDLDEAMGTKQTFLDDWIANHPATSDYWEPTRYQTHFSQMDVPVLNISGWYDGDQPGAPQNFVGMRRHAPTERARDGQFLLMGPWSHAFNVFRQMGHVDFGEEAIIDLDAVQLRFFDRYLKEIENGIEDEDPVSLFVMGENRWRREKDWPLPQTQFTPLYFGSRADARTRDGGGLLAPAAPDDAADHDEYRYDPMDLPELELDFTDLSGAQATEDQTKYPDRMDDVEYVSPPLANDVEITGPVEAVLHVSTDAADTDFAVNLLRRTPEGALYHVAGGAQSLRYRTGRDEPVPPGTVVEVTVDCWATSVRIPAGDRLHVVVSSMVWPGYARNMGTLESPLTASEPVIANNRVYHTEARPSRIVLPIVPREDAPGLHFRTESVDEE